MPPRPSRPYARPILLLLAALAGCIGAEQDIPLGQVMLEGALGVELDPIVNDGPGEWGAEVRQAWVDLEVGTLEGAPETVFGNIRSVDVDEEGRVYLLDSQAHQVRVFEADGSHFATWGREGDGPTDIRRPAFVRLDPDENVVVYSFDKTYKWFTPEGELLHYASRDRSGIILRAQVGVLDDGRVLDWDLERETILDDGTVEESPSLMDNPRFDRFSILRVIYLPVVLDPATGTVDTLPPLIFDEPYPEAGAPGGGARQSSVPRAGRYWVAWSTNYLLAERGLDGTVHRSIERRGVRYPPVTDSVVDAFFRQQEQIREEIGGEIGPTVTPEDIAATGPVLGTILRDDEHLLVFTQEQGEGLGFFVDVFRHADGRYLGKIELPVEVYQTVPPVLRNGMLYGVTMHEVGYPQLIRLDLGLGG